MRSPLQRVLYVDFLGALSTVVVMLCAAGALAPHVGIAASVLRSAALLVAPFVVFVLLTARSSTVRAGRVYGIVAFNVSWLFASGLLLVLARPTVLGTWIVVGQALPVLPLVFVELKELRTMQASARSAS